MAKRRLEVDIIVDERGASRAFGTIGRDVDTLGSRLRTAGAVGARAFGTGLVAATAAAAYGIKKSVDASREAEKVARQTEAVIESTGGTANVTAGEVENLANKISLKAGVDDEAIQSGANLLLTFKNIRNEAGEGNRIFDQTVTVAADMAAALGKDLPAASLMIGKALNFPTEGMTRLTRAGVEFTDQQKAQVEALENSGNRMAAQKIILRELRTQFAGSAEAQSDAVDHLSVAAENAQESIGGIFMPVIEDASETLTRKFIPRIQRAGDELAAIADRDDLDWGEKFNLAGPVLEREFGDVPEAVGNFIDAAIPVIASRAGDMGVALFKGMLEGFADSDLAGKAAIGVMMAGTLGPLIGGLSGLLGDGLERETKKSSRRGISRGMRFGIAGALAGGAGMLMGGVGGGGALEGGIAGAAIGSIAGPWGMAIGGAMGAAAAEVFGPSMQEELAGKVAISAGDIIKEGQMEKDVDTLHKARQALRGVRAALVETGASAEELSALDDRIDEIDDSLDGLRAPRHAFRGAIESLREGAVVTLPQIEKVVRRNARRISQGWTAGSTEARENTARNYRAAAAAIQKGMDQGLIHTREGLRRQRQLLRNARLVEGSDPVGIAEGFARSWKRAGKISGENVQAILKDLRKMPEGAREEAARTMIEMAQRMAANGNLPRRAVARLRSALVADFGNLREGMVDKTKQGLDRVGGLFDGLVGRTAGALNTLGANFSSVAGALGIEGVPSWHLDYSARPRARGGRLDHPVILAGEEAPQHPEWVIATNPAYRSKNLDHWMEAGRDLGVPGFREGGQIPDAHLRGGTRPLRRAGQQVLDRTDAAAERWLDEHGLTLSWESIDKHARKHGLSATSTLRPGDAGSFHGIPIGGGRARATDYSNSSGPTPQMFAFGTSLGEALGSKLEELIYTPLGWAIDNGQRTAPYAQADHYDHVHVAFRTGGKIDWPAIVGPGNWNSDEMATLAHVVGMENPGLMGGIAKAESGGDPKADNTGLNSDGSVDRGLWQINSVHGYPATKLFDPLFNARAAKDILGSQGLSAWSTYNNGSVSDRGVVKGALAQRMRAAISGRSSGAGGGGGPRIPPVEESVGGARMIQGIGAGRVVDVTESVGGNRGRNVGTRGMGATPLPPGAENLPRHIQRLLRAPGLNYDQQMGIVEMALGQAQQTETTADDREVLEFQRGLVTTHRAGVAQQLRQINRRLRQPGLTPAERRNLIKRRNTLLGQLGTDTSTLTSINDQLEGLDESAGGEGTLADAIRENTEMLKSLQSEMEATRRVAESELAIGLSEAKRALADMISGELGPRQHLQAQTAGDGMVGAGAARRY
jgi:hypothetical protein